MPMFDYPLPLPPNTLYDRLGVGPEAETSEIEDARKDVTDRLKAEVAALREQLGAVAAAVNGLEEATAAVAALEEKGAEADPRAVEAARLRRDLLRQKAAAREPHFPRWLKDVEARLARIKELDNIPLTTAEERCKYDAAGPPLALLRLADCTTDGPLADRRQYFRRLRLELAKFLAARGERVFHPSDLTRDDFAADFLSNPLLDGTDDDRPG